MMATTPSRDLKGCDGRRHALDLREVKLGVVALDDSLAVLVALGELQVAGVRRVVADVLRLRLNEHVEGLTFEGLERVGHVDLVVVFGQAVIQADGLESRGEKFKSGVNAVLVLKHDVHVALCAEGLVGGAGGDSGLGRDDLALTDNHLETLTALTGLGLVDENLIHVGGDETELDFSTFFHFMFCLFVCYSATDKWEGAFGVPYYLTLLLRILSIVTSSIVSVAY